jgi:hypothetical protein
MEQNKIKVKLEHPNGYRGILFKDGTMDIYYKEKPIYFHGSNKVTSVDEMYRALDLMPKLLKDIKEQNEKDFER